MNSKRFHLAITVPVGIVMLIVTTLSAQQQQQQHTPPDAQITISEAEWTKAAHAFAAISKISTGLQSSLEMAKNKEQAQKMQQDAQKMMISEVENAGLTVERYNEIMKQAQTNDKTWIAFSERVRTLEQKKQNPGKKE